MKSKERESMRAELEVLRTLGENGGDYLFLWEYKTGRLHLFGDIHKRYDILQDGAECCTTKDWLKIVYEKDRPAVRRQLDQMIEQHITQYNAEYRLVDREKNRIWVTCRGHCQMDEEGKPVALVGRVSDTALAQKVDQLTGAFNAVKLSEDINRILKEETTCYLLLLGVDNFKHINLRHGREYGSQLLCCISDVLEEILGFSQPIYRTNGDCFAVNLFVEEPKQVEEIYREIRTRMGEYCTISAGVVSYHEHQSADGNALFQYAEEALDKAKRVGKDTLAFFSQKDFEEKLTTVELQEELRQSIQDDFSGFSLVYQPQIHTDGYHLFGVESLLRYTSPTRGAISPVEFIPVLEQSGLICQVGEWVLWTALRQCSQWRSMGLPDMHISVNISYIQLSQKDIAHQVLALLEESGLPGNALTLEVTESIQLQDYPHFNRLFYQWKRAGIEISVDDFGTGYSSLAYLKNLDIDEIKIDRCFVSGIQYSAYNYRLLKNMIELARSSQIRVCCEGVEVKEELAVLAELEPDLLQGFLFDMPITPQMLEQKYIQQDTTEYQRSLALRQELHDLRWSKEQLPKDTPLTSETLEEIVEALDEIVYVSDPFTHELYYLNPAGCRLTGTYDYKGCKCYKVLQGKDGPCDFCTNNRLQKEQFYIWEWNNKQLKRHFIVKDKLIPWHGRMARLEVAVDISERDVRSEATQEKLNFTENMLACIKALAEEKDMTRAIQRMLASVGEFYLADRAYVFELDENSYELWGNAYEWCQKGHLSRLEQLRKAPPKLVEGWLKTFERDESVVISDLNEIKAKNADEWEFLHGMGVRRLMVVPIRQEGKLIGFFGVDNPHHRITDDALIRMLTLFVVRRFNKNETEERLSELLNLHYRDVLKDTDLGLWFMRIDPKSDRRELFADETMRRILGLERELPPQDCYQHWYSHVNDGYYQYVNSAMESMIESGRVVQMEYPWQHPVRGEVMVVCSGVRTEGSNGMICLEGYYRIISDVYRPQFLPEKPIGEIFEFNERKGAIYFHTERTLLAGDAVHESGFPESWLKSNMVHPHFVDRFSKLFRDVRNAENVDGEEILLRSKKGSYDWFRLRIRHLGREAKDRDTILVLLDAADELRLLQLENMRIRDFYRASLGETIAYAELDLEGSELKAAGGLWSGYEKTYGKTGESLLKFMMRHAGEDIRPNQKIDLLWKSSTWAELLSQAEPIRRFRYQRKVNGEWRWVELVLHSFREKFSKNTYALLYLRDIDAQVRKEQAQKEAASRDPLTGIYNRNAFEAAVVKYMEEDPERREGVLILLDIDDFKTINDRQGHLEGDAALQYVTRLLRDIFRQEDLLGRLGGDEFMIFLKGALCRETLDQRMEKFYRALAEYTKFPITCSAGITAMRGSDFAYQKSVFQADMALYRSKQRGKCHYTYAEDKGNE